MTHVTGKAPLVYEKELVLAACKSHLRDYIHPGDWMAGWTSQSLKSCPTKNGEEQLVYLALVDKKISQEEFQEQYDGKPTSVPIRDERPICHEEDCPDDEECTGKEPVLICKEFYYFGAEKAFKVLEDCRPAIPENQGEHKTLGKPVIDFLDCVRKSARQCLKFNRN